MNTSIIRDMAVSRKNAAPAPVLTGGKKITIAVTFDQQWLMAGRLRAQQQRRSFSNYLVCLTEADCRAHLSPEDLCAILDSFSPTPAPPAKRPNAR